MKKFIVSYRDKKYKVSARDSIEAVEKVKEVEDDRLSPMTYSKLKEMGYSSEDWKDLTQEQANELVAKGRKETQPKEKKEETKETETKSESKTETKSEPQKSNKETSTENKEQKKPHPIPWEELKNADYHERRQIESEVEDACRRAYKQGHYVVPSFNISAGSNYISIEFQPSYDRDDIGGFISILKKDLGNAKVTRTKGHDWYGRTRYYVTIKPSKPVE